MNIIKKCNKKIISIGVTLIVLMANVMPTFAEVINSGDMIKEVYGWDKVKQYPYMTSIKKDSKGNVVYCMNAEKPAPDNQELPFGGYLDDVAYRILKNGYPNKSLTGDKTKDYVITQLAFWAYVDSKEVNIDNLVVLVNKKEDTTLTKHLKNLYNKAINDSDTQDIQVKFSKKNMEATLEGKNYVTPYFRVNVTGDSVSSGSFKMDMKTNVNGVKYQLRNGSYVSEVPMNTDFRVTIPKTASEGKINIRANGKVVGKKVSWYKSPNTTYQNVAKLDSVQVQAQSIDYANITWTPKGKVEVTKKSEDGNVLQGAGFKLVKDGKNVTEVKETDLNGKVVFDDLEIGTYQVIETKAPQGHVLNGTKQNVTVTAGNTTKVEVSNDVIKGKVKVLKVDKETNEPLKGAEFELREKTTGKVAEKLVTGEDGTAISKLHPFGEYILQETKAPNKYTLNNKEYLVTISEHMKTINVTAKNSIIKGKIEVNKSDSDIKDLMLEGIEFEITDEKGSVVDTLVTDENGYAISKSLNYGKYFLKETKTLPTHILSDKIYEIEITENGKVYTYDIKNDVIKGKIQIVKIDKENNEVPVKGAIFDVIAEDVFGVKTGTVVDTITSDENGFAYTKNLRAGRYKIVEKFTPEGYWESDKEYFVDITEDGKVYKKYISNAPIQAKLKVVKKDAKENYPLANAEFKIVDKKTGKDVEFTELFGVVPVKKTVFKTDENGEFITPQHLKYGTYELVEVKAPQGYNLAEPIEFSINKDTDMKDIELLGTVTTQEVTNNRITGNMELLKIDKDTKNPLKGVEFKVTCTDGFMKDSTWDLKSNEEGKVSLSNLEYGKYKIEEIKTKEGYVLNSEPIEFEVNKQGQSIKLEMTNKMIKGNVEVEKVDSEKLFDLPLKNAEFTIYNKDGKEVDKLVTNIFGQAKSRDLLYGKYTMKETKAPQGYLPSDTVYEINVNTDGQIIKFDIENNIKKGKVEIIKKDSELKEDLPLAGAEFTIYDLNRNEVDKLVTDQNGYAISKDIRYGCYIMKETKAPQGYLPSDKIYEIEITEDGQIIKFDIENNIKKGKVEIIKKDSELKEDLPLAGAEFTIYDLNRNEVDKLVTDQNGYAISKDIRYGCYIMKETKAPQGYLPSDKIYEIEITEDGQVITFDITNDVIVGDLEFEKTDISTGEIIEGAKIVITGIDQTNSHIKLEFTSSKEGNKFKLPYGKYRIKETDAPKGYVKTDEIGEFEIKEDGEIVKAELKNKRIEGFADFKKIDKETKEIIEGAEIKIECIEGFDKGKVIEFTSSKEGNKFKLPYGKYRIKETDAPKGYVKTDEIGEFEIKEDDQIVSIELENKKMTIITENPKTGDLGIVGLATVSIFALAGLLFINLKVRSEIE